KIILNQLSFYGYHGLFQEEKQLGQRFLVDATLNVSLEQAGNTDEMQQWIDYGAAFTLVEQVVIGDPRNLIEDVDEEMAATLLNHFHSVQSCIIKVTKPNPPISGQYESVAVEINRSRSDFGNVKCSMKEN